jgi:hypothetical protein
MSRRDRHPRQPVRKATGRLLATSLAFVALFFAGASVSAWAGSAPDGVATVTDETGEVSTAGTTTGQGTVPSEPPGSEEDPSLPAHRLVQAHASRLRTRPAERPASAPVPTRTRLHAVGSGGTELPEPQRAQAAKSPRP